MGLYRTTDLSKHDYCGIRRCKVSFSIQNDLSNSYSHFNMYELDPNFSKDLLQKNDREPISHRYPEI